MSDHIGKQEPHRSPGQREEQQVIGGDQQQNDQRQRRQPQEKGLDAPVAVHVAQREGMDDATDEGDGRGQKQGQGVDPQRPGRPGFARRAPEAETCQETAGEQQPD